MHHRWSKNDDDDDDDDEMSEIIAIEKTEKKISEKFINDEELPIETTDINLYRILEAQSISNENVDQNEDLDDGISDSEVIEIDWDTIDKDVAKKLKEYEEDSFSGENNRDNREVNKFMEKMIC